MLRQLTVKDHQQVMKFLNQDPSLNLFIIGDIEGFGYETSFQSLWGEFTNSGLKAILLKFYDSYIITAQDEAYDADAFASLLTSTDSIIKLSGKANIVAKLEDKLGGRLASKNVQFFAECTNSVKMKTNTLPIKQATTADVDRIMDLRCGISEFKQNKNSRDMLYKAIATNTGRSFYLENNFGEIVCSASTTAETSDSAMIVAVCTHKDYRGKGYATGLLSEMINILLQEKHSVCLFYDNPDAGRIYTKIGFNEIGLWAMHR